jgi:hypothetical protein
MPPSEEVGDEGRSCSGLRGSFGGARPLQSGSKPVPELAPATNRMGASPDGDLILDWWVDHQR